MTFWDKAVAGILAIFGSTAGQNVGRFVMKAAAATAAFTLFFGLFMVSWNAVVNTFGVAAGEAVAAMANDDAAMALQTFRCLLPSSTGAALTLLMSTFLQAIVVIWTRRIIFTKLAA